MFGHTTANDDGSLLARRTDFSQRVTLQSVRLRREITTGFGWETWDGELWRTISQHCPSVMRHNTNATANSCTTKNY